MMSENFLVYLIQNYNAKLSNFGLANDLSLVDKSNVSTKLTYGYAAPEYLSTGIIMTTRQNQI